MGHVCVNEAFFLIEERPALTREEIEVKLRYYEAVVRVYDLIYFIEAVSRDVAHYEIYFIGAGLSSIPVSRWLRRRP